MQQESEKMQMLPSKDMEWEIIKAVEDVDNPEANLGKIVSEAGKKYASKKTIRRESKKLL